MYEIYFGPRPGQTDEIKSDFPDLVAAVEEADRLVRAAADGRSLVASVFSQIGGRVVVGLATPDLAEAVKPFPRIVVCQL